LQHNQRFIGKCYKSMFNNDGSTKYVKVLNVTHDNAFVKEVIFTKMCAIIQTNYIPLWGYRILSEDSFGWGWQDSTEDEFISVLNRAKKEIEID